MLYKLLRSYQTYPVGFKLLPSGTEGSGVGSGSGVVGYVQALPSQVPPLFTHVVSASLVSGSSVSVSSFLQVVPSQVPPSASHASFSSSSAFVQVPASASHSPPLASHASCSSAFSEAVSPFDLNSSLIYPFL